jgi:hypothetical protein
MNVFVLNTGRCGSTTFSRACLHITNYTSGHETRTGYIGASRFQYPPQHIETDNRLSWMLGRLDSHYGADAFYVYLKRDKKDTARSFEKRYGRGIIGAYRHQILRKVRSQLPRSAVCEDYCETVYKNIELFLRDKSNYCIIDIERAQTHFPIFWERIGAEGDLQAALRVFRHHHNASKPRWISRPVTLVRQLLAR